jgi:NitT/TauT family transport system substrate-binding protein
VVTDYVKANGMGGIDADRMAARSSRSRDLRVPERPDAALYFTDAYLPPTAGLMLQ